MSSKDIFARPYVGPLTVVIEGHEPAHIHGFGEIIGQLVANVDAIWSRRPVIVNDSRRTPFTLLGFDEAKKIIHVRRG